MNTSQHQTKAWICGAVAVLFSSSLLAAETPKARERFEKAMQKFDTRDEEMNVKIVIVDSDGSQREREIQIQRAGAGNEQRMIARVMAPADLKGTSLLSVLKKGTESQWLYLPSSKQTRKIVGAGQKDGGILGSELRYEDFNPSVIPKSKIRFTRNNVEADISHEIFETLIPEGTSPYEKAQIWIDTKLELPTQIDYFTNGQKMKTIKFLDYRRAGTVLRPHHLVIKNHLNERGTEIHLSDFKINTGIALSRLSVESLSR